MEKEILTKPCCEVLGETTHLFNWFTTEEGDIMLMPYLLTHNTVMQRVNYCPFCGSYIREIQLKTGL